MNTFPYFLPLLAIASPIAFCAVPPSVLLKDAKAGDPVAMRKLAYCLYYGENVKMNKKFAVNWWKEAAKHGDVESLYYLGMAHEKGGGVPRDMGKAIVYYKEAARRGEVKALYYLGMAHEKGSGVPRDMDKAIDYYKRAAEKGNKKAAKWLADHNLKTNTQEARERAKKLEGDLLKVVEVLRIVCEENGISEDELIILSGRRVEKKTTYDELRKLNSVNGLFATKKVLQRISSSKALCAGPYDEHPVYVELVHGYPKYLRTVENAIEFVDGDYLGGVFIRKGVYTYETEGGRTLTVAKYMLVLPTLPRRNGADSYKKYYDLLPKEDE